MERFHFNPIPLNDTSRKFFANLETLHNEKDQVFNDGRIYKQCIWYYVDYQRYLKEEEKGIDCKLIQYSQNDRNKYRFEIPNGVKILENTFKESYDLTSICIPNSVIKIGYYCFANCYYLDSIEIPSSIVVFGEGCFKNCMSLTSIIFHSFISELGDHCFKYCSSLKKYRYRLQLFILGRNVFSIAIL